MKDLQKTYTLIALIIILLFSIFITATESKAQGWMFSSMDEVRNGISDVQKPIIEGVNDSGIAWMSFNDDHFEWVLFFDGELEIVYESHFICKSYDAFLWALEELDKPVNKMIRQGDGHWIFIMGSGAIDIQTHKKDYSDYPVLIYTYKYY